MLPFIFIVTSGLQKKRKEKCLKILKETDTGTIYSLTEAKLQPIKSQIEL